MFPQLVYHQLPEGCKDLSDYYQSFYAHTDMHRFDFTGLAELTQWLCDTKVPVYLTIDMDCLDPSAFPGTGMLDASGVSTATACKTLRELLLALVYNRPRV